jgi:hypothetical protein
VARLLGLAGAAALALAIAGCGGETAMSQATDKSAAPSVASYPQLPNGAIAVGDDVYMVPIGKDARGCTMYRVFSFTKAVAQAIHYRADDDRFVMNKDEAACSN